VASAHPVFRPLAIDLELPHLEDDGLRAVDKVLVDGRAVFEQLFRSEAVLVDDLHLLHDSRLARLARAYAEGSSAATPPSAGARDDAPSRRILHSFLNLRRSSSICLSISSECCLATAST
jgi:hypothetical protein